MNNPETSATVLPILAKIDYINESNQFWIVGYESGKLLYELVRVWRPKAILEIGTSIGYSALWMALALEQNDYGKLWTVESHSERFEMARQNFELSGLSERIQQIFGHAPEVIIENFQIPMEIDFVFLDAVKEETRSFFDAIEPKLSPGALIAVDNVQSHRFGEMMKFIEFMYAHPRLQVLELPVGNGLMLARWL